MHRKNQKNVLTNNKDVIKKSNELSIAEMNRSLTLVQMQLLAFMIYSTQTNRTTTFKKVDFEKKFGVTKYNTTQAYKDSEAIMELKLSSIDVQRKKFKLTNVFTDMEYDNGLFSFQWNPNVLEHILELKERFIVTDLSIATKFKSFYSWRLYEYLKAHFGYWFIDLTKEELMNLFGVSKKKSYINNTAKLRQSVLDIAIEEINLYSEIEVWYKLKKDGRKIIGFEIHWSTGKRGTMATENQLSLIREIHDEVMSKASDYITASNTEQIIEVQKKITIIKKINEDTNQQTTKEEADNHIKRMKNHLEYLNDILE